MVRMFGVVPPSCYTRMLRRLVVVPRRPISTTFLEYDTQPMPLWSSDRRRPKSGSLPPCLGPSPLANFAAAPRRPVCGAKTVLLVCCRLASTRQICGTWPVSAERDANDKNMCQQPACKSCEAKIQGSLFQNSYPMIGTPGAASHARPSYDDGFKIQSVPVERVDDVSSFFHLFLRPDHRVHALFC